MKKLVVVKVGGKILEEPKRYARFLEEFAKIKSKKILVHGGGREASAVLASMGMTPKLIQGRRITDEDTLKVVVMVYAGWMNKSIVSQLNALGVKAVGLSGADGNLIQAHKRIVKNVDYGFAGDIDQFDDELIQVLLGQDFVPVLCAITHDDQGQLLNTNADTIVATVASELAGKYDVSLRYCFEYDGVLVDRNDTDSVIKNIDATKKKMLIKQSVIADGMIPKVDNALAARKAGVQQVCICGIDYLNHLKIATHFD